jgi:5'-nucleotidase (lipoprotein e(P4) family)
MTSIRLFKPLGLALICSACAPQQAIDDQPDQSTLWVRDSAEYRALSSQVYRAASVALPALIADETWSAIPYQANAANLPPAIIMDIDQTVIDGVDFQIGHEPPFTIEKFDDWNASHVATPVPGAPEFVKLARASGVRVFFLTNRFCNATADNSCEQKPITVQDLHEASIPADDADVSLAGERPDWGSEKKVRRDHIAGNYRVIMLFGDDLGDFIPCVRRTPVAPCTTGGTIDNRFTLTAEHDAYWGTAWYLLPNPMYGSWTTVR